MGDSVLRAMADRVEDTGGRVLPLRGGFSVAWEVTGDTDLAVSGTPGRHAGARGITL